MEDRKGYKNSAEQVAANKRYLANNPEAKERQKIAASRSHCKRYIRDYMTVEEYEELTQLMEDRIEKLKGVRLEK